MVGCQPFSTNQRAARRKASSKQETPTVQTVQQYPVVKPLAISTANTSGNVAITAVLPAIVGNKTFFEGFDLTGGGATAASTISVTVTGLQAGTLAWQVLVPAGAGNTNSSNLNFTVRPPSPLPTSGTNSAITVNVPSLGAGNTNVSVTAYGFSSATIG